MSRVGNGRERKQVRRGGDDQFGLARPPFGQFRINRPLDDLLWIEHSDPGSDPAGMSTNAYALLAGDEALIFDAAFDFLMPAVDEIARSGYRPAALVLSHRHLVGVHDLFPAMQEVHDAPVMLHPLDATHRQAARSGAKLLDPTTSPILPRFGVEAIHFRGQTEGSVMLYRERAGLLLAGDSAMGPTAAQTESGVRHLVRAPYMTNVDEDYLREAWKHFDRPARHVGPYHGTPQMSQPDIAELMKQLSRPETTGNTDGSINGRGGI